MDKKELLKKLKNEKNELAQKIMVLGNSLYFGDMPAKDLIREQLQAMDKHFEILETRINDLEYDISIESVLDDEEDTEVKQETPKREPNFIDQMCDELNERVDDLVNIIRGYNRKGENKPLTPEDLEGREIINVNPPHCHECCNDGTGCVKLIMAGDKHICVK